MLELLKQFISGATPRAVVEARDREIMDLRREIVHSVMTVKSLIPSSSRP